MKLTEFREYLRKSKEMDHLFRIVGLSDKFRRFDCIDIKTNISKDFSIKNLHNCLGAEVIQFEIPSLNNPEIIFDDFGEIMEDFASRISEKLKNNIQVLFYISEPRRIFLNEKCEWMIRYSNFKLNGFSEVRKRYCFECGAITDWELKRFGENEDSEDSWLKWACWDCLYLAMIDKEAQDEEEELAAIDHFEGINIAKQAERDFYEDLADDDWNYHWNID
jgi:hypothetical protein